MSWGIEGDPPNTIRVRLSLSLPCALQLGTSRGLCNGALTNCAEYPLARHQARGNVNASIVKDGAGLLFMAK